MKDFTDITVILDRSGSMNSVKEATASGFDEFVESQKRQGDNAALTLVQFDDVYEYVWNALPIKSVPSVKELYQPRGMTALLDAIGRTINETGKRLAALPEKDRPNKVTFVIMTDGFENASKEFTHQKIAEMIRHQESTYNWTFMFLGANQDAIASAVQLGMRAGWAATYNASDVGSRKAFSHVSNKMSAHRCCTSDFEAAMYASQSGCWTPEEKADLLSD